MIMPFISTVAVQTERMSSILRPHGSSASTSPVCVMPGTAEWWLTRPVWFALYIAALLPLIAIFARYERGMGAAKRETPVPHLRLVIGMIAICTGLAMTAAISIASPEGVTGVRLWVVALPFVGAALVGFGPVYRWVRG